MKKKDLVLILFSFQKGKGFTLIELLVVISIIGLLSTLAIVSLKTAREKARDAKRLGDIKQIEKALDMYYDANNRYPIRDRVCSTGGTSCAGLTCLNAGANTWAQFKTDLAPFLAQVPDDPSNTTTYCYGYDMDGTTPQSYVVFANMESNTSSETGDGGTSAATPVSSTLYELGADRRTNGYWN